MKQIDVVTMGETMVLFTGNESLPIPYVHQFKKQIGGAESNVAIGLARLGYKSGWLSKLGDDPFGTYIHHFIRGEGVDTTQVQLTNQAPTGIFFKESLSPEDVRVHYYRHQSAASTLTKEDVSEDYIKEARVLHLTGITPALSSTCKEAVFQAITYAQKHSIPIVFDPNIRYKLWNDLDEAKKTLLEMATHSDIILAGEDEGAFLTGEKDVRAMAMKLKTSEAQHIIVKKGKDGAYILSDGESFVEGFPVEQVVDPVGAGDGFAVGVISAYLDGHTIPEGVKRGNAIGSLVVKVNGDIEGLPTRPTLEQFLSNQSNPGQDVKR
ncbi:sugar kinase [Pontibacillus yanchengensis]|uniref:2-dehydro-3-deoxygluconokinase n=1 Tax=Pontibacillus yanchengensis Y32 TaxID=1385514 RepID=A0A0A2TUB3_9BACI|nr:sugar kinase [Pontibacillus yanchengensis]KGP72830.1 2-dehydro-3-deoxygluconokinase [Pontibacillus yanchengensis Y32]